MLDFLLQNWFLQAILITVAIGIVAFINKIFAEKKYDAKFSTTILYAILSVFALVWVFYSGGFKSLEIKDIIMALSWGLGTYFYSIIMMTALKYLPTSTYFVSVRLISAFIMLLVGIIFFQDNITFAEIIGWVLGFVAMTFLFEKEKKRGIDYKKGYLWLAFGVGTLVFVHIITKEFSGNQELFATVLSTVFLSAFVFSVIFGWKNIRNHFDKNKEENKNLKNIIFINFIQAIFYFFYFVMLFRVYGSGDLGISYKIQSYSPFIPIILSAFIFKEKISKKKKIALIFVAISLWFFS